MRTLLKTIGIAAAGAICAVLGPATVAQARDWPNDKPIRIVFPFPAGPDFLVRMMAADLEEQLGQTVIVDNKPGAGGTIGMASVAHAKPDGYTYVVGFPGPSANYTNTYTGLPYAPLEDFDYVSQITHGDMVVVARADFPADDLGELLDYARAHPGEVSAGNPGIGSYGHMIELMVSEQAEAGLKIVPYQGTSPILVDLLSGSLDISIDFLSEAYTEHLKSGSMKALGIASAERNPDFPDVPTFQEAGVDLVAPLWSGVLAPKGTPDEVIAAMNEAIATFLASEEAQEAFARNYQRATSSTPEELQEMAVREEATWRDIIKKYDIRNN
ncbi:Bug family tripartite tricarboxylate transporter substrate binding protein [Martelella soudanensis]|uniref:Bug family tripartite tricarboxylate transporter substrate binding protein n=1 Tax=unclassified Martelella TaxID=2629616 RepID=UPI0015DECFF6|nr:MULTISPECIES: tripartite tricarboxylate transporter substrate binding protein [unclassified Martelella]